VTQEFSPALFHAQEKARLIKLAGERGVHPDDLPFGDDEPTYRYTTITAIEDHGTIVVVYLKSGQPVFFDHRQFQHLWDAQEGNVIGQRVRREENDEGGETVIFEDEE
jgi:hypothetical protein